MTVFKRIVSVALMLAVGISNIPLTLAEQIIPTTFTAADFKLSEGAVQAGCTIADDASGGILLSKRSHNDNHATSNIWMDAFVFSADVEILNGSNPLLTFGVQNRDNVPSGDWYAICPNRYSNAPAYAARIFKVSNGGLSLDEYVPMTDEQLAKTAYNMKVSVDSEKNIKFYIDDQLMLECQDLSYSGGYIGLLSWDAEIRYSNIKLQAYETEPQPTDFKTNLTELNKAGQNGNWALTSEGYVGQGSGDAFAISDSVATDFVYDADVNIKAGDAASLIFRSNDSGSNAYVANVDLGNFSNARIFKFTDRGAITLGEYKITDKSIKAYNIRVEVKGASIKYYLNDRLIISCIDSEFKTGKLGLLVCNSTVTYNNVFYSTLNDASPTINSINIENVKITPAYTTDIKEYTAIVSNETASITLSLDTEFQTIVNAYNKLSGLVLLAPTTYIEPMKIALSEGENLIMIKPKDGETISLNIKRRQSADTYYNEQYRPQFHITPEYGWLNDPNGLVYFEGEYHVFYQYYPDSKYGQDMKYWAHMVSTDLVHWQELPVALAPDEYGSMWSGSCVADINNTSGLFDDTESKSGLVIFYTCTNPSGLVQRQCMAYSKDKGRSWIKYNGGAPIIDVDDDPLKDGAFRDPKVFWHEESEQWMMICAGGPVRFFSSTNLIDWKPEGMQPELGTECADFYKMKVEGSDTEKWVLSGGGVWYMIGDFRQVGGVWKFIPENNVRTNFNAAVDTYAGVTFNNAPDNRRIMVSWMVNLGYADRTGDVTDPYNGALTVPYELKLMKTNGSYFIDQQPIKELETLRAKTVTLDGITVDENSINPLKGILQDTFELEAVVSENQADAFGFILRAGNEQQTVIQYDRKHNTLTLDRSNSGASPVSGFLTAFASEVPVRDGKLNLKIIVDRSSVELFANGKAFTSLIFPEKTSIGMELYAKNGAVKFDTLRVHKLHSIFREETQNTEAGSITVSAGRSSYSTGSQFTVFAVPDKTGSPVNVSWSVSNDKVLEIVEAGNDYVVLKAIGSGDATVSAVSEKLNGAWEIRVQDSVFNTNLEDLEALGGIWTVTPNGLEGSGRGNAPIISQSKAADFSYEASFKYIDGNVGAALIFRATDDLSTYYTVDICERDRNARILKFTRNASTGSYSDVTLGRVGTLRITADHQYRLKVVCAGSSIQFYVNDKLVTSAVDSTSLSGRFGLNVCDITGAFQDVYYKLPQVSDDNKNEDQQDNDKVPDVPSSNIPLQNGSITVGGKTILYKNGKAVIGTKVVTLGGKAYLVLKGYVATGKATRVVKVSKKKSYIVNKYGIVQKGKNLKLIKISKKKTYIVGKSGVIQKNNKSNLLISIGKKSYIVNKAGVIHKSTKGYILVKIGKKKYIINKSGLVQKRKKKIKVKKVTYKTDKKGVATKKAVARI